MPRLIDADEAYKVLTDYYHQRTEIQRKALKEAFERVPTVDAEPTEEQVKEFCRKRCLVIVTSELFNEMKARWSAEPVKHGHWKRSKHYKNIIVCDECGEPFELSNSLEHWNYCPNCGAKMDEVKKMKYEWIVEIDDDEDFHLEEAKWKQELVRCKDCKHYGTSISGVECQGYCKKTEYITKKDNDFCSWGERK